MKINLQIYPLSVAHAYRSDADFFKFNIMTFELWGNPQYLLWILDIIISIAINFSISIISTISIIIIIMFFLASIFKLFLSQPMRKIVTFL